MALGHSLWNSGRLDYAIGQPGKASACERGSAQHAVDVSDEDGPVPRLHPWDTPSSCSLVTADCPGLRGLSFKLRKCFGMHVSI